MSATIDISAPLAALAARRSYGGFFDLTGAGATAGWCPIADCYAEGHADLAAAVARRYGTTELRIGASIAHLGHAARLWSPVLGCALGDRVLPVLDSLHRAADSGRLFLADPVGVPLAGSRPDPRRLYRTVMTEQLERLEARLPVRLAPGLLAGNSASALVEAARELLVRRPELRAAITETTAALLQMGRLAGTGGILDAELAFRRRSCCLYYRTPAGRHCTDCGLRG